MTEYININFLTIKKMKNFYIFLFFFLCFFNIIKICDAAIKQKFHSNNNKYEDNNEFGKINNKEHISRRKLEPEEADDGFVPLKIFIDTNDLNSTCNSLNLNRFLKNIVKAMYNAKEELEKFILINPSNEFDLAGTGSSSGNNYIVDHFGIEVTDNIFSRHIPKTEYNYFIFGKCVNENINEDSASVILEFQAYCPYIGIILLNANNIEESKFTEDNLTLLMLHHFIRLLGFSTATSLEGFAPIPSDSDGYYLDDSNFHNVINYAKDYFNCPNIERINLYVDDENLDSEGEPYQYNDDYDIVGLYWPK